MLSPYLDENLNLFMYLSSHSAWISFLGQIRRQNLVILMNKMLFLTIDPNIRSGRLMNHFFVYQQDDSCNKHFQSNISPNL